MKRYLTAVIAAAILASGGTIAAGTAANDPIVTEVTKANDFVQLATKNDDAKGVGRVLTDDFILVLNRGKIMKRAPFLADIADPGVTWIENKTEDLEIHHYNGNTALAIGILHMRYKEKNQLKDVRLRYIDVWVKQNGQWKWASSQVAHLTPEKKP